LVAVRLPVEGDAGSGEREEVIGCVDEVARGGAVRVEGECEASEGDGLRRSGGWGRSGSQWDVVKGGLAVAFGVARGGGSGGWRRVERLRGGGCRRQEGEGGAKEPVAQTL
jgi:hypothetical protein